MKRPLEEDFYTMDGTVEFNLSGFSQAKDQYIDYILQASETYTRFCINLDRKKKPLLNFQSFLNYQYKTKK